MMTNSLTHRFTERQLWYFATVSSFALGWTIGWMYLYSIPHSHSILIWVPPPALAGLAVALSQWVLIRKLHKYSFLWVPITTVGFIVSMGAALTLVLAIPAYLDGSFSYKFDGLLEMFTPIAPIALLVGPICQWLFLRNLVSVQSSRELIKLCVGWLTATFLPFATIYLMVLLGSFIGEPPIIITIFAVAIISLPSGLVYASATKIAFHSSERWS